MALDLSGYVDVAQRLRMMFERFPALRLVESPPEVVQVGPDLFVSVTVTAWRTPDDAHPAVATAWEPYPGKSSFTRGSEMMNAATSALGRVANLLMPIGKSLASMEEVLNRRADEEPPTRRTISAPPQDEDYPPVPADLPPALDSERPQVGSRARIQSRSTPGQPTDKQRAAIATIARRLGMEPPALDSVQAASEWIKQHGTGGRP